MDHGVPVERRRKTVGIHRRLSGYGVSRVTRKPHRRPSLCGTSTSIRYGSVKPSGSSQAEGSDVQAYEGNMLMYRLFSAQPKYNNIAGNGRVKIISERPSYTVSTALDSSPATSRVDVDLRSKFRRMGKSPKLWFVATLADGI
jgi:hypothetical protein